MSSNPALMLQNERRTLIRSLNGFVVPSMAGNEKLRMRKVKLIRRMKAPPPSRPTSQLVDEGEEHGKGNEAEGAEKEVGEQVPEGVGEVEVGDQSVSEVTPSEVGGEKVEEGEDDDE